MKYLIAISVTIVLNTINISLKAQDSFHQNILTEFAKLPDIEFQPKESWTKHVLEVSHGQAFVDWTDSWAWFFSGNYLYKIRKNIALGGGAGFQFDWTGIYPLVSINSIFGNKSGNFGFGLDLRYMLTDLIEDQNGRIWIYAGCYYRNFFVKVMPTFAFGWPGEWAIETGYSFDIGR